MIYIVDVLIAKCRCSIRSCSCTLISASRSYIRASDQISVNLAVKASRKYFLQTRIRWREVVHAHTRVISNEIVITRVMSAKKIKIEFSKKKKKDKIEQNIYSHIKYSLQRFKITFNH